MSAETRQRPGDFIATMRDPSQAVGYWRRALDNQVSLSVQMQRDLACDENIPLDAFCQTLMACGIRTRSLQGEGIQASTWADFCATPATRALAIEFARRQFLAPMMGRRIDTRRVEEVRNFDDNRGLVKSNDFPINSAQNPYYTDPVPRWDAPLQAQIPVSELIALETGITANAYRAVYLVHDTNAQRLVRVGEGAEIPRTKIVSGQQALTIYKFGRALESTYEENRRMTIDHMGFLFGEMGIQIELDRLLAIIDVLLNGDGNSGPPPEYQQEVLDPAATTDDLPTLKSWLGFKMKFPNPYAMTTVLTTELLALQLMLLNTGSTNIPLLVAYPDAFGGVEAINQQLRQGVRLGWSSDVTAHKIIGFDARRCIERVYEVGAEISETENFILNQTKVVTMTMVEGFAIRDKNAVKIYDSDV
jgi:hypothetical protein